MPTPPADPSTARSFSRPAFLGASFAAAVAAHAGVARAAAAQTVRVSFANYTVMYAPYLNAMEKGYYADEGLDLKITTASGGIATPAQLSGTIDINTSGPIALSPILRGAPLKIVYTEATHPVYQLWSTDPALKSLKDLKGKQVGINARGDTLEISTKLALLRAGLPLDWVNYTALGTGNTLAPAFAAKALPAVVLANTDVDALNRRGLLSGGSLIVDMIHDLAMPYSGISVSDAFLRDHADAVIKFLRATLKGTRYMRKFKQQTLANVSKYFQYADPSLAGLDYDEDVPILTRDGTVPDDVLRKDMEVRAAILEIPKDQIPPISRAYDYRFVRQVNAELDRAHWTPTA